MLRKNKTEAPSTTVKAMDALALRPIKLFPIAQLGGFFANACRFCLHRDLKPQTLQ
jgi:hypothetical protein